MISAERLWEWKRLKALQRREKLEALKQKKAAEALKDGSASASPQDPQAPAAPTVDEAQPSDPHDSNDIMYPPPSLLPPDYLSASDAAYNYDNGYQYGYGYGSGTSDNGAWSTESPGASPALVDSSNYYNNGSNYTDYYSGTGSGWDQRSGSTYDATAGVTEGYQGATEFYQDATATASGGDNYDNSYGYAAGDYNSNWSGEGVAYDAGEYATAPAEFTTPVEYTMDLNAYEQAPDYSIDVDASGYTGGYLAEQQEPTPYGASDATWTSPWEEVFDPQTGQTYYCNRETGKTAWEMPAA